MLNGALELVLKIIIESSYSHESDIGGIHITFLKNTFFGQSILT